MSKMKLRIYKAFPAYQKYLDLFYNKNDILKHASYYTQLNALKSDFFPWVLSWSIFNNDDSVEIFETIHNAYYLQQAWGNDVYKNDENWQQNIVLAQIKEFQPEVCVLYSPEFFKEDFLSKVRSVVHHDILIGGYDGMDRQNIDLYKGYDFVITCSKYISNYYWQNNKTSYPLEFAFDPSVNKQLKNTNSNYAVGFSGSMFKTVHNDRVELLRYLAVKTPIVISSDFELNRSYSLLSYDCIRSIYKRRFKEFYSMYCLHKKNIGPLYGLEMFQFLKDSSISLNLHGDRITFAANVRLYEATGVGSCLLTDWKENIGELFVPDKEIVTFVSKEEALDKIKYLKRHDYERRKIAENGRIRTLSEYTYSKRIPGVIEFVRTIVN